MATMTKKSAKKEALKKMVGKYVKSSKSPFASLRDKMGGEESAAHEKGESAAERKREGE